MKKYFIVADVHGFYDILEKALAEKGYDRENPDHIFVSLGDLFDRGSQPKKCLEFVMSLPADRRILIRGNHEDLMEKAIARKSFAAVDWHNGTALTAYALSPYFSLLGDASEEDILRGMKKCQVYNDYIQAIVPYYEGVSFVFVHGWIPRAYDKDGKSAFDPQWRKGDWDSAVWLNGMEMWNDGVVIPDKTIFCGHWHTSWGHHKLRGSSPEWDNPYSTNPAHQKADFSPFIDKGIVALDACTAYSHKMNCYVLEEE